MSERDSNDQAAGEQQDDRTVVRDLDPSVSRSSGGGAPGEATSPRVLKQRFVLDRKLGSGGMGTVFRAKDLRKVEARDREPFLAVKVLNNDFRDRPEAFIALQREASKSQAMSHTNIVSIFDFDKDGDLPFMTMEWLKGSELSELLKDFPSGLPIDDVMSLLGGLCDGLQHAHDAGVVHADFKPGNVFVCEDGQAKIFDFGIARAVHREFDEGDDTAFDLHGMGALTPAYASAEMLGGEPPVAADDIYALGIVVYLMLTGRHPFNRVAADDAERQGLAASRPKGLSNRQWRSLQSALAFRRADRPGSVDAFRAAMLNPSWWQTRPAFVGAAAVLVALLASAWLQSTERADVIAQVETDVRLERVYELMAEPRFDSSWHSQLSDELAQLADVERLSEEHDDLLTRLRELYSARILDEADPSVAWQLFEQGRAYGALDDVRRVLAERAAGSLREALLTTPAAEMDASWVAGFDERLAEFEARFSELPFVAELRLEREVALMTAAREHAQSGRLDDADSLRKALGDPIYDLALSDEFAASITAAQTLAKAQDQAARKRDLDARFEARMVAVEGLACARLTAPELGARMGEVRRDLPAYQRSALRRFDTKISGCVEALASEDPDAAKALRLQALQQLGDLPKLSALRFDPCALSYLVDAGSNPGRGGFCMDSSNLALAPRLVVVNGGEDRRFAITKTEVTWAEYSAYCSEVDVPCPGEVDPAAPVTGISVDEARDFAAWLSRQTGYQYRLPTLTEWQRAAAGAEDPNRNCRLSTGGIERGLALAPAGSGGSNPAGLLNAIGNAQEWVIGEDGLLAVGGSFRDEFERCSPELARVHSGQADEVTGFRLVREVS